jgi:hypothetical protein
MSELQASVRLREQRQLEKQMLEAAEQETWREKIEFGVVHKTEDHHLPNRESVRSEIRAWRKRRESSCKGMI